MNDHNLCCGSLSRKPHITQVQFLRQLLLSMIFQTKIVPLPLLLLLFLVPLFNFYPPLSSFFLPVKGMITCIFCRRSHIKKQRNRESCRFRADEQTNRLMMMMRLDLLSKFFPFHLFISLLFTCSTLQKKREKKETTHASPSCLQIHLR